MQPTNIPNPVRPRGRQLSIAAILVLVMTAPSASAQENEGESEVDVDVEFVAEGIINITANVDVHDLVLQLCDGRSIILDASIEAGNTLTFDVTAHVQIHDSAVLSVLVFLGIGEQGHVFVNAEAGCVPRGEPQPEPCAPENVSATATSDGVLVDWDEAVGASGYNVYRQVGGGQFELVAQVAPPDTEYLDTDLVHGDTYTYRVTANFGEDDETEPCGEASATAIPVFPTLVAASMAVLASVGAYGFLRRRA